MNKVRNILFLNNYYYLRGGSEKVFFDEIALLESHGHTVVPFSRKHPDNYKNSFEKYFPSDLQTEKVRLSLDGVRTVSEIVSSRECKKGLERLLTEFKPDIAHAHNIYGRLTSSVIRLLAKKKIPVVMTLHDYKLVCPSYKMEIHGRVCEKCEGRKFYHAILNRCLKDSAIASGVYALESYYNNFLKVYKNNIRYLISPSEFLKNKLVQYGWDENRIKVIRNSIDLGGYSPSYTGDKYFLYIGRLSREKGIPTLINAFMQTVGNYKLVIAGSGPLEAQLRSQSSSDNRIHFTGYLTGKSLQDIIARATAIVVPSEWYENAPMSVIEGMAYGKPVIGGMIGGIPEQVTHNQNGLLFKSGDASDLTKQLQTMIDMVDCDIESLGINARKFVEANHGFDMHYDMLTRLYQLAMS